VVEGVRGGSSSSNKDVDVGAVLCLVILPGFTDVVVAVVVVDLINEAVVFVLTPHQFVR
jgi:hypothetical protein